MTRNILILGGTAEAIDLATKLAGDPQNRVITSLAGRTRFPALPKGEIRTGGFGGIEGLAAYLEAENINLLIDATHPFATNISSNAQSAAELTGVPFERHSRPPWRKQPEDNWTSVNDEAEVAKILPTNSRVLLAIGSQHLAPFFNRDDICFTVRMIDPPKVPLAFADHNLIIGKPGGNVEQELALLRQYKITHLVCRNSGGENGCAKIEAARMAGIEVLMINRPGNSARIKVL